MRKLMLPVLLAGAAALGGCVAADTRAYQACGTYGLVDRNGNGFIESGEWTMYRTSAYGSWDSNRDGRISRAEFQNCWYGGGFYAANYYNRDHWGNYWSAFDANRDGFLDSNEYWSSAAWARMDRNRNGRIDPDEYRWW
ncbi:MAG TPA: hypothetical protein VGR19_03945 [Allosphingosinicella sp.]|nr:hypothetical protein [Allosphingosinicella sp.]